MLVRVLYLALPLTRATPRYDGDTLMDADNDAVMMEWERPLMSAHADIISSDSKGKTVLNVGFGMGIVDGYLQGWEPEMHYIIEAHPGVHEKMLKDGWGERKNVTILFGRWQDRIKDVPTVSERDASESALLRATLLSATLLIASRLDTTASLRPLFILM